MIKILIPIGWLGGGDRHAIEVFSLMKNHTFLVHIILPRWVYEFLRSQIRIKDNIVYHVVEEPVLPKNRFTYLFYFIKAFFSIFMKTENFDIIYCPGHQLELLFMALLAKFRNLGAKVIVWIHHLIPAPKERAQHGSKSLLDLVMDVLSFCTQEISITLMKKYANVIFTPTKYAQTEIIKRGFPPQRVIQIGNGVDLNRICGITTSRKILDGCTISVYKRKGTAELLKMWSIVKKQKPFCKLAVIGSVESSHRKLLSVLNLEKNVELYGFIPEEEKIRILKSCKFFISTSYEEGWSLSISEAMACKLPVVAYDLPVYKEVFEDKLITAPVGNINEMAKKIIFLLENPEDAKKIGEASREFVRRYDWSVVAERELSEIVAAYGQ